MTKTMIFGLAVLYAFHASGETNAVQTRTTSETAANTSTAETTFKIQDVLVSGHSNLKLYMLSIISQGQVKDGINDSFLPGFRACSEDSAVPVRSVTARLLGQHFISGKAAANPEAVALLIKLSRDQSEHVRYNAFYYGLSQIDKKTPEIIQLLIEEAAANREQRLYERITESLADDGEAAVRILDEKLKQDDAIAFYEIYEDLTGRQPTGVERFLDMPSSMPKLFVFKAGDKDAEAFKDELGIRLKTLGLKNPELTVSGGSANYVLLLKTYLTSDRIAVEEAFDDDKAYSVTQELWLTPELEAQIEAMPNAAY
jgi:hypothetical protein